MALPFLVTLMVVMTSHRGRRVPHPDQPSQRADRARRPRVIDGPVGGPVNGKITMAQANIPRRSGLDGFRASMPRVLSKNPDFVTLNEASGWSLAQIEAAAPATQPSGAPAGPAPATSKLDGQRRALEARHLDQGQRRPGHARRRRQDLLRRPPGHLGPVRHLGDPASAPTAPWSR